MIRKTTGRIICFALAAVLVISSYVPSHAADDLDITIDESIETISDIESNEQEAVVEESVIEEPARTLLMSGEQTTTISIHYEDDLTFNNSGNQQPTSIEMTKGRAADIIVPFPDIPDGFKLASMNAYYKTSGGYMNLPDSRDDETSTYTFSVYSYDSMDVEAGITIEADFAMIIDEDDPNAELIIPIRYSINYHFPDSMPKYVKGKEGEKVYFKVPYPDVIPEGYALDIITASANSYYDKEYQYLDATSLNDNTYLFEYYVSKKDVENGITIKPWIKKIVDLVFEESEHGKYFPAVDETYNLDGFYWTSVKYLKNQYISGNYFVPEVGYVLKGLYYSQEMDENCVFFLPGQGMGTQISSDMLSEDGKIHVYTKWEPITAKIILTFDGNSSEYSVTFGEKFPDFSKSTYSSYYVKNGSAVTQIIPGESQFDENISFSFEYDMTGEMPTNFCIYVYGEKNQFSTVSFDTGLDDVVIEKQKVRNGKTVAKPNVELEKEGYYLAGWCTDAELKKPFAFGKTLVNTDITLYANWKPVDYQITFHSNYGKDTTTKVTYRITEKDAEKNKAVVTPGGLFKALSAKEGFLGWMGLDDFELGEEATGKDLIEKLVEKYGAPSSVVKTDLYAQWDDTGFYSVILDSNLPVEAKVENLSGNLAETAKLTDADRPFVKQKVSVDESLILTGEEYALKGFTFGGWEYTGSNGKKVTLKPSSSPKNLTAEGGEITVKAIWKKVSSYRITYKLNGGTSGKNKTTVTYNANEASKDGLPLYNYKKDENGLYVKKDPAINQEDICEVVREGYDFAGWTSGADYYTYYGDDVYQNLTLTAIWTPQTYTLKFMDPDGVTEYFAVDDASFDSSFALKNYVPEKGGFIFKGWEGTLKNKVKLFTTRNIIKLKDIDRQGSNGYVLTAKFTAATYKISYNLDGGKIGSKPTSYVYGKGSTVAVPNPNKEGFEFLGWSARVTNGQDTTEYTLDGENGHDTSDVIDSGTGKITSSIYGNIELVANWKPYTYDIKFYGTDGTEYDPENNVLANYLGLTYAENVDFTSAAMFIEAQDGFEEGKSIKGFALTANAKSPKYVLYKKFNKLAAKNGNGTVIKVYPVLSGKVQRVNYTVTLMPNANNVLESADANVYINNSKGVQYVTQDADGNQISEFAYNTTATLTTPGWKRYGYELIGFGTSAKATTPITSLEGLGNGKTANIKLYAIWKGHENTITYTKYVQVYDPFMGYEYIEAPSFEGKVIQTYNGKDITLKTVSLEGYTFKGWKVQSSYGNGQIVTSPSLERGPIKKVLKNNCADLVLEAAFERVEYIIKFNLNGGLYNGSKQHNSSYHVNYFIDQSDLLEEFYKGVSRAGYVVSALSTTKNGKNKLELYDSDGNRKEISGLSNKNGSKITIYPIWTKVSPSVPSAGASLSVSEGGSTSLSMTSTVGATSENSSLVFEYSTSPLFIFGVKSVELKSEDVDPSNSKSARTMTVQSGLKNKSYYVRVKYGIKDSTGKYVYSKYSKIIRAARLAN